MEGPVGIVGNEGHRGDGNGVDREDVAGVIDKDDHQGIALYAYAFEEGVAFFTLGAGVAFLSLRTLRTLRTLRAGGAGVSGVTLLSVLDGGLGIV